MWTNSGVLKFNQLILASIQYLVSGYFTCPRYVGRRRSFLDGKIIISYMRANHTTRYGAKKLSDHTAISLNDAMNTDIITAAFR